MQKFGEKLRTLRNQNSLTLRQLGAMLEVSHTFVAQLENGEKIPNVAMVLKIATIFDVTTDVLIKDDLRLED